MPHIFSFFAGAGFLDLGFEHAGFTVSFANENYKPFLDAYLYARAHLRNPISAPRFDTYGGSIIDLLEERQRKKLAGMIKEIHGEADMVGFIGGPPCPDFSVGGKNRGREGEHGKLSASYIELICQQQPDFFLFENVKGLWRTKRHREFYEELKQKVHSHGYITSERLINSIGYGAPQNRERIILVGFHRSILPDDVLLGLGDDNVLPDNETLPFVRGFPWNEFVTYSLSDLFSLPWPSTDPFQQDSIIEKPFEIPADLTVENWFEHNNVINHPNAEHYFKPRAGLIRFQSIPEGDDSKKSFKRLHRWRYSPTAAYGNNEVHLHPYKARRITVAEALAIQSLPADFVLPPDMTLSNMFKTVGNGVPYMASYGLAHTIRNFLEPVQ